MKAETAVTYLAIEGEATSSEEAIRLCGMQLIRSGCVRKGFAESCIEREREFPTGICSEMPVAIPHSNSDAIVRSGLCYLRLQNPVTFFRMDDEEKTIMTRHVFNLAMDQTDHLAFLSKIVGILQNSDTLAELEDLEIEQAAKFLREQI